MKFFYDHKGKNSPIIFENGEAPRGTITWRRTEHGTTCWSTGGTLKIDLSPKAYPLGNFKMTYGDDNIKDIAIQFARKGDGGESWWWGDRLRLDITFEIKGADGLTASSLILGDYQNYKCLSAGGGDLIDQSHPEYNGWYIIFLPEFLSSENNWRRYTRISIEPGCWLKYGNITHGVESNAGKGFVYTGDDFTEILREELHLPILTGAGKYHVYIKDAVLMVKKSYEHSKYSAYLHADDSAKVTHFDITVNSIFTNDPTRNQALIAESPNDGEEYYNGQYPMGMDAHLQICAPVLASGWSADSKTYAIVYIMLDSDDPNYIDPKHCMMWYSYLSSADAPNNQAKMTGIFQKPRLLFDEGVQIDNGENEYGGKFRFAANYAYLITDSWERPDIKQITIQMPATGDRALQFAALLFRVVPAGEEYVIDPDCPTAIETHLGIFGADKSKPIIAPKTIKVANIGDVIANISWSLTWYPISNPLFVDITRRITETIGDDGGTAVGFQLLRINDDGSTTAITDDQMRYPLGTAKTSTYEHIFYIPQKEHIVGAKYKIHATIYSKDGTPETDHIIENELEVRPENIITDIRIEPRSGAKSPQFRVTGFAMDYVQDPNAKYWYTLTAYELPLASPAVAVATEMYSEDSVAPSALKEWILDPFTLPTKGKYLVMFEVWDTDDPQLGTNVALASYSIEYEVEGAIENPRITDIYNAPDKRQNSDYVVTKWAFEARAKGFGASAYKWQATLSDSSPEQQPIKTWDFEDITSDTLDFEDTATVNVALGDYKITLSVMDADDEEMSASTTLEGTIGGAKAEGFLGNGTHRIKLSNPLAPPSDTTTEYRLMREGFAGTCESPWELRNESVVGSTAAGVPVWMVHPRTITLRVLVTAPEDNIIAAIKELIGLLTANPRSPIDLILWTSDGARQLIISGYPEVGTPVIETRESTGAIVAITLNCPRYAWRSSPITRTAAQGGKDLTITPVGNLPPALDIWLSPGNIGNDAKKMILTISAKKISKTIAFDITNTANVAALNLHYDPILQDLTVQIEKNTKSDASSLLAIPPHGTRGASIVRNGDAVYQVENAFDTINPESDLSALNIEPGVENTISTNGVIDKIILTPYYAHWW